MTYLEKLQHPNWQQKRLEIFKRDDFRCTECYSNEKTLHVHHKYYDKNLENPWDYNNDSLITLCYECHKKIEDVKPIIKYYATNMLLSKLDCCSFSYNLTYEVFRDYEDLDMLLFILWENREQQDRFMDYIKAFK